MQEKKEEKGSSFTNLYKSFLKEHFNNFLENGQNTAVMRPNASLQ